MAMPNPVTRNRSTLPSSMDPSKYQVASSTAGSLKSGAHSHSKRPSCLATGAGTLIVSSALVSRSLTLFSDNFCLASSASFGGFGQPPSGRVAEQCALCCSVPTSFMHSWQRLEAVSKEVTCAFLACGHCPPFMAEDTEAAHFVSQRQPAGGLKRLPRSAGCTTPAKSISSDLSLMLCGTSILPVSSPGKALQTLASRHLLTELSQALTMAAGESSPKLHKRPRSSTASLAEGIDQPSLCKVANKAVTGPAATDHHEHFAFPSLTAAAANVSWSCSAVNHFSHQASAQYCTG